jgi:hypothetical protein
MGKILDVLTEAGINYTRDPKTAQDFGFQEFTYYWSHPKGQDKKIIFCRNRIDLLTLLNRWNSGSSVYKYWM